MNAQPQTNGGMTASVRWALEGIGTQHFYPPPGVKMRRWDRGRFTLKDYPGDVPRVTLTVYRAGLFRIAWCLLREMVT